MNRRRLLGLLGALPLSVAAKAAFDALPVQPSTPLGSGYAIATRYKPIVDVGAAYHAGVISRHTALAHFSAIWPDDVVLDSTKKIRITRHT